MKKLLHHSIDLILFSNMWVALSVAGLVLGFAHYHCIDDCWLYALFSFTGTFATYNFHRLVRNRVFEKAAIITERNRWQSRYRTFIIVTCCFAVLTAATVFFYLPVKPFSLLLLGISGIIVLFYAIRVPLLNKSLRDISGLKNVWIILVWLVLISIPMINREKAVQAPDLLFIAVFLYLQIIPFDIRDSFYDAQTMKTLPQLTGIHLSRWIGTLMVVACGIFMLEAYDFNWFSPVTLLLSLGGLWWKQGESVNRQLELIWDGTILSLGLFYYSLPCIHS